MKAKLIGALMVLIAGALPTMATAPCHQAVVVQKHVQAEVVYPAVQAVNVVVPVYGIIPYPAAYYAPTPALVAPVQEESRLDRLEKMMERLLEQRSGVQPLSASMTATNCASCHSGSKANVPKIDFAKMTPDQKALSAERVLDGSMPPKSRLSKEERRQVVAEFMK